MENIPPQIIDEIRSRSEIVEVISRYLPLKARGKNYYGLCPFHAEKTPSFTVSPEKQIFHCFGCGVGGDIFGFLMKKENLSFVEAAKFLASQCGVVIPSKRQSSQELRELKTRQELYKVNEITAAYYRQQLQAAGGQAAVQYLTKRDISSQSQQRLNLGYAPAGWDNLLKYMRGKGIDPLLLRQVGLIVARQNQDGWYDRFRERIIFPIYDYRQRLVGFGGRSLDENKNPPKYLNSPESSIYHKGEGFYGLNWSKEAIRKTGTAIVVEGYLDFIALQQAGIENVVAPLGTAFTQQQARLISHYASELVLFFDADIAGAKAAARSFPLFLGSKLKVRVAQLPAGDDPDSFVRRHGAQVLSEKVAQAVPLVDFVLTEALSTVDLTTVEGQVEAVNQVLPLLAQLPNALERDNYRARVAQRLGIKEPLLLKELEKAVAKRRQTLDKNIAKSGPVRLKADELAQEQLLALMLKGQEFLERGLDELEPSDFSNPAYQEVFLRLQDAQDTEKQDIAFLIQGLNSQTAKNFVSRIVLEEKTQSEYPRKVFEDGLKILTSKRLHKQMQTLRSRALTDRGVLSQYNNLLKQLKS